jgi:hypothetical protein
MEFRVLYIRKRSLLVSIGILILFVYFLQLYFLLIIIYLFIMSYSNVEILSATLVVACLLLLYCWYQKRVDRNSAEHLVNYPGLKLRGRDDYVPKPNYGMFPVSGHRDGYVPLGMNINKRGAMTRDPHFSSEGMSDRTQSLHELVTDDTPASKASSTPVRSDNDILWWSDGSVPQDIFSRDGAVQQDVQLTEKDGDALVRMALGNSSDASAVVRNPSMSGHFLANADYTHPSRELSW